MVRLLRQRSFVAASRLALLAMVLAPLPSPCQTAPSLYSSPRIANFKSGYAYTAWPDRVVVRRLADGREDSVYSGKPGHSIPESFRNILTKTPELDAQRGAATSARTALFGDEVHVQVYEGGGLIVETSTQQFHWFRHRRRTAIGRDEPEPRSGEIVAYEHIPSFVGNLGMMIWDDSILVSDNDRWMSDKVYADRQSHELGGWVRGLLEKNPDVARRLGSPVSDEQTLLGGVVKIQVFDGGVIVRETASGKTRAAWHAPRGWGAPPTDVAVTPTPRGSIIRPDGEAQRLTYPTGAVVDIPAGALSRHARPKIEGLAEAPPMAPFRLLGSVYQITARSLINVPQPIVVELPAPNGGDRAVVLVLNGGRWLRVPSETVTLRDGQPAQRVRLVGVAFPWTIAVAAVPEGLPVYRGVVVGLSPTAERLRLEQLRWTDRTAYLAALRRLVTDAPAAGVVAAAAIDFNPLKPPAAPTELFSQAQRCLLKADPELHAGNNKEAVELYLRGLDLLWQARIACPVGQGEGETAIDRVYDPDTKELVEVGSRWKLDELIEQYCGRYAPWGLQLILELARKGELKPEQFDLRVIPEYGSQPATDVLIHEDEYVPSHLPWNFIDAMHQKRARDLQIPEGQAHRRTVMRFWSPQVMEWQLADLVQAYQTCDGWASWLVALGKLSLWAEGGVTLGVVYEAGMPVLEKLFIDDLLGGVQEADRSWGMAAGMGYENAKEIGGWIVDGEEVVTRKNIRDLYTNVFLAWWLGRSQIEFYNHVREASANTAGYASHAWTEKTGRFPVPPIMLLTTIWGPTSDSRTRVPHVAVYPQGAQALMAWAPDYAYFAAKGEKGYDLHDAFERRSGEWFPWHNLERCWQPFRQDEWVYWRYDSEPIEQQVAFYLDRKEFEALATARHVSPERLLDDLFVEVRIGEPSSRSQFYPLEGGDLTLHRCLRSTTDDAYWFAVRLRGERADWREAKEVPEALLEDAYAGPELVTSYRPHRQYSILVKGKKEREAAFILPVTFSLNAPETKRQTAKKEEAYVDRTTARVAPPVGRWYTVFQDIGGKPTSVARLFWEPKGAVARAIIELQIPPDAMAEWTRYTGLASNQIPVSADRNSQALPVHYVIRDATLNHVARQLLQLTAVMGNEMLNGWGDLLKQSPSAGLNVTIHDFSIVVTPAGAELHLRSLLDASVEAGRDVRRQQFDTPLRAVPE